MAATAISAWRSCLNDRPHGKLTAIAPGKLLPLVANGTSYSEVFACDARNVCAKVADIDIVH
jgi:hypothetical protein